MKGLMLNDWILKPERVSRSIKQQHLELVESSCLSTSCCSFLQLRRSSHVWKLHHKKQCISKNLTFNIIIHMLKLFASCIRVCIFRTSAMMHLDGSSITKNIIGDESIGVVSIFLLLFFIFVDDAKDICK